MTIHKLPFYNNIFLEYYAIHMYAFKRPCILMVVANGYLMLIRVKLSY